MSRRSKAFAWLALGPGLIFCLVGLWGRVVGASYVGFGLVFGIATLILAAMALLLHWRWLRRQPDGDGKLPLPNDTAEVT